MLLGFGTMLMVTTRKSVHRVTMVENAHTLEMEDVETHQLPCMVLLLWLLSPPTPSVSVLQIFLASVI